MVGRASQLTSTYRSVDCKSTVASTPPSCVSAYSKIWLWSSLGDLKKGYRFGAVFLSSSDIVSLSGWRWRSDEGWTSSRVLCRYLIVDMTVDKFSKTIFWRYESWRLYLGTILLLARQGTCEDLDAYDGFHGYERLLPEWFWGTKASTACCWDRAWQHFSTMYSSYATLATYQIALFCSW